MIILKSLKESDIVSNFSILEFKNFSDGFYIKIKAELFDGSILHIKEYNDVSKRNYSYHWQDEHGKLLIRWDNAPHHKHIVTFPHHKHSNEILQESYEITLEDILKVISGKIKHQ
jgi:hypothetical protein